MASLQERFEYAASTPPSLLLHGPPNAREVYLSNPAILLADILTRKRSYSQTREYIVELLVVGKALNGLPEAQPQVFTTYSLPLAEIVGRSEQVAAKWTLNGTATEEEHKYQAGNLYLIFSNLPNIHDSAQLKPEESLAEKTGTFKWYKLGKKTDDTRGILYRIEDIDHTVAPYNLPLENKRPVSPTAALLVLYANRADEISRVVEVGTAQRNNQAAILTTRRQAMMTKLEELKKRVRQVRTSLAESGELFVEPMASLYQVEAKFYFGELHIKEVEFMSQFLGFAAALYKFVNTENQILLGTEVFLDYYGSPMPLLEDDSLSAGEKYTLILQQTRVFSAEFGEKVVPIGIELAHRYVVCLGLSSLSCVIMDNSRKFVSWKSLVEMLLHLSKHELGPLGTL